MNAPEAVMAANLDQRREQMFPALTPAQIARLERYARRRRMEAGEVLVRPGERFSQMMVLLSGSLEVLRPNHEGEHLVTVHEAGSFTGEINVLRGLASLVMLRVRESGEMLVIDEEKLHTVVQTDAELSELFMRAFILRRVGLVGMGQGDVILLGSRHCSATLRVQQFLTRNVFPFVYLDVESDECAQALVERFQISMDDIPVVVCRGTKLLRRPSNQEIASCLGMNPEVDACRMRDLIVIGAGPAGLAAAVYAASEGLDTLVLETSAPGGQAGSSSKIENYLGFPTGISGQALSGRALAQAQKFGADVMVANTVKHLDCRGAFYGVELTDGQVLRGRSIVIATGAQYRSPLLENLEKFVGMGIYYAATHLEAQLCKDEEVVVIGGGNSAGQAAVFLAGNCRQVHLLVRADDLSASMSRYLIRRIDESPNIHLRTRTQLVELMGDGQLDGVAWRHQGERTASEIRHVFLMMGAEPNTQWLKDCVCLDSKGFVRTGPDLRERDLSAPEQNTPLWPLERAPYHLETNLPRVFAVGDVRCGSVKRVASAVGEGSVCVQMVHRALAE